MKNKTIILSVLAGLLIGLVCVMFEVPSIRAIARFGSFMLLAGIVFTLFGYAIKEPNEPAPKKDCECKLKSERGSAAVIVVAAGVVIAAGFILLMALFEYPTVKGDEVGVLETWEGVNPTPLQPKTYPIFRPTNEIYTYKVTPQSFENVIEIKSSDNQRVHISYTIRWRRNPDKIVWIHQKLRDPLVALKPESDKLVATNATVKPAIEIYSGETQNALRADIEAKLQAKDGLLAQSGIIIDQFVFTKIDLDTAYVTQIEQRQVAVVSQSRAHEQQKAALAQAEVVKAEAQADLNRQVVAAQRDKDVAILKQQADSEKSTIDANAKALNLVVEQKSLSEKQVLAAEADAKAVIAAAEAQKQKEIMRAVGIEAVGKAEAEAQKLRLQAYAVPGADAFVRVEVSKQLAAAFAGVKGYLPSNVNYTTVGKDFDGAVNALVGAPAK